MPSGPSSRLDFFQWRHRRNIITSQFSWPRKALPLNAWTGVFHRLASGARTHTGHRGYNISVTIVDRAGDLKLLLVGDGASALSREPSRRKAYTSAMRRITTADLAKQVATPGAFNPTLYDTQMVTARGGVPIKVGNQTIGAIGVSGAPGGDKDEACADAGLAKISDRLN
jgi:uncharacterized protein GlcG (DUF336 family)